MNDARTHLDKARPSPVAARSTSTEEAASALAPGRARQPRAGAAWRLARTVAVLLPLLLVRAALHAQCAMCNQSVEKAAEENAGIAAGFNSSILFFLGALGAGVVFLAGLIIYTVRSDGAVAREIEERDTIGSAG